MYAVIILTPKPFERYLVHYFPTEAEARKYKAEGEYAASAESQEGAERGWTYMRIVQEIPD